MKLIITLTNKVSDIDTKQPKKGDARYKLTLTDGEGTILGLLPLDMKDMVDSQKIQQFTLIRLNRVTISAVDKQK